MSGIRPPDAIQWHEGMLLAPQHFQQQTLRLEALLHQHLALVSPFHWGIRRLRVDPGMLLDGVFRVLDLAAIMPDGLFIDYADDLPDLQLALGAYREDIRAAPRTVWLAVPALRPASGFKGELARYDSVDGPPVTDANTGEDEVRIPRLRPRLALFLGDRPPPKFTSMPVAEVTLRDEALALSDYVPPCLRVPATSPLGLRCSAVARRLREKAAFLVERLTAPAAAAADPLVMESRAIIAGLVSGLPPLEAVIGAGVAHPFAVYQALCGLCGHVAALSAGLVPPVLPPYDHDDLRATFDWPLAFIARMIETVHEGWQAIPFAFDGGSYRLTLRPGWLGRRLVIGARHRPGSVDADVSAWLRDSLIGSEPVLASIGERRILGAGREGIARDEDLSITPARGMTLFAIAADPAFIRPGEPLVIHNRADPRGERGPAEIVLYVANTRGPKGEDPESGSPNSVGGRTAAPRLRGA